jgi:hypothetical protein
VAGLVNVERRRLRKVLLSERLRSSHRHDCLFPGLLSDLSRLRTLQLDDARRLGIDAEIECELPASFRLQRSEDRPKRRRCELRADVPDDQQI